MRLELTRVGLLVELANHYTTKGAYVSVCVCVFTSSSWELIYDGIEELIFPRYPYDSGIVTNLSSM